jgi:hypothetical protein
MLTFTHTGLGVGGGGRGGGKNLYLAHPQHTTTLLAKFLDILLGLLVNANLKKSSF